MTYSINPNIEKSRGKAIYDLFVNKVPLNILSIFCPDKLFCISVLI